MIDPHKLHARPTCTRISPPDLFDIYVTAETETARRENEQRGIPAVFNGPERPQPIQPHYTERARPKGYSIAELANGFDPAQPAQPQITSAQPAPRNKADQIFMGTLPGEDAPQNQPQSSERIPDYF